MSRKKYLATSLLTILLTFCLAVAAFASPGPQQDPNSPVVDTAIESGAETAPADAGQYPVLGVEEVSLTTEEQQMLGLVNKERAALGVQQLQSDSTLVKLARLKAQDMIDYRYFGHTSPTYGSPFDMMKKFGVSYSYAGENLAMAPSVSSAHKALMGSPGHRANILKKEYDRVGIGIVVSGGQRYCVQLFTGGQTGEPNQPGQPTPEQTGEPGQPAPQDPCDPNQPDSEQYTGISADESLMVQLINSERAKAGLPRLTPDEQLFKVARLKARDFVDNHYFSHTSPTYGSLYNMLNRFGVEFTKGGENLAVSYNVTRAHNALMASLGNRANLLSEKYSRVGIGIADNGRYKYFVQLFADGGEIQPPSGGSAQPPQTGEPPQPPATDPAAPGNPGSDDTGVAGLTADEQRMLDLVNAERAKNGQPLLKANLKLTEVARLKARDMIDKNYFSHTSPTYGSPFDMMRKFGITYGTAGENLAGAPTVDTAHTNLMNSSGHRANILNGSFREVGIGIVNGGPYGKMIVQMFIG